MKVDLGHLTRSPANAGPDASLCGQSGESKADEHHKGVSIDDLPFENLSISPSTSRRPSYYANKASPKTSDPSIRPCTPRMKRGRNVSGGGFKNVRQSSALDKDNGAELDHPLRTYRVHKRKVLGGASAQYRMDRLVKR
jgi:hypothetical protein